MVVLRDMAGSGPHLARIPLYFSSGPTPPALHGFESFPLKIEQGESNARPRQINVRERQTKHQHRQIKFGTRRIKLRLPATRLGLPWIKFGPAQMRFRLSWLSTIPAAISTNSRPIKLHLLGVKFRFFWISTNPPRTKFRFLGIRFRFFWISTNPPRIKLRFLGISTNP